MSTWRKVLLAVLAVVVVVASTVLSGYLGALGVVLHYTGPQPRPADDAPQAAHAPGPPFLGAIVGGLLGLAAGVVWCVRMFRPAMLARGARLLWRVVGWGALLGGLAGVLLHVGLMAAWGFSARGLSVCLVGLTFGTPSGLGLGLLAGLALFVIADSTRPAPPQPSEKPSQ